MKMWTFFLSLIWVSSSQAQQLAFPSAEGFGRYAVGGRYGEVYHVTNLNDTGSGSFRDAVSKSNRTVVFDIGGIIKIKSKVKVSDSITIAGQTAPGEGIIIYGNGVTLRGAKDVIVRYMRFRGSLDMSRGTCTLSADYVDNVIFDHVSVEWGRWDNLHIKNSKNITLQYCIIGAAIGPQRFGALLEGPENLTIHHCLWVNNQSRNPKGKAGMEFINNVIYNWGSNGFVGGHSAADHYQDIIANYFIAGPNSSLNSYLNQFTKTDHVFQDRNFVDLNKNGRLDGELISKEIFQKTGATIIKRARNVSIKRNHIEAAKDAYQKVINTAGASLFRDPIDSILISHVVSLGEKGFIFGHEEREPEEKQKIDMGKSIRDKDKDGIPDQWELENHLNPHNSRDGGEITDNGYTNLENYLHSILTN